MAEKTAYEAITERVLFGQRYVLVVHPDHVTDQLRFEAETQGHEIREDPNCKRDTIYILDLEKLYTEYVAVGG